MTWIYIPSIPSIFSPATADSASDSASPVSKPGPYVTSNGTNIASKSFASVKSMDFSMTLPSGTISNPSTVDPGVERWIFSVLASRANLTQTRGYEKARTMTGTSGPTRSESSGKWDPDSSSWRTSQASLWEVMDGHHMGAPWLDSWPKQGMTRNGELYPLPTQARHTSETGGGSLPVRWNTPNTMDSLSAKSQQALDHEHETARPGRSNPNNLRDQVAVSEGKTKWHIPTPTSADVYTGNLESSQQSDDSMHSVSLPDFVGRFPTPRAGKTTDEDEESWLARHAAGKVATPPLALAARMLPAPSSGGDSGGPHGIRGGSWAKAKLVETFGEEDAVAMSGGSLSPDWVSWLMGIPIGWTSLEPLPREEYDEWFQAQQDGTWWQEERGLPRVSTGISDRVNRLKCLGNGIVPASLALFLRGTT